MREFRESPETDQRFAALRCELVEHLRQSGITDHRVLAVMGRVRRERFVADDEGRLAYIDHALPIDCGQTISQPYTVAFMCQALQVKETDRVLEIGTGSGYNAAILAELAAEVYSIERYAHLAQQATQRLRDLGYGNVHVKIGDGTLGWPEAAPYDAIIVTAAARILPKQFVDQLADGGRIVIPIGPPSQGQRMCRFTKQGHKVTEEYLGRFQFVPLIGEHGWNDAEGNAEFGIGGSG